MKHLVIGTDSAIGKALFAQLTSDGINVAGTNRTTLDLATLASGQIPQADVVYICAAISKLDACEKSPDTARKVNVEGTLALAEKLKTAGCFPIFLSSNHVFDGTTPQRKKTDVPCPINEYGRQKAETERGILALSGAVLRLTKVVTPGDARINAWADTLKNGQETTAFDDIWLAPSTLENVLAAMRDISEAKKSGIHQLSGHEDFSYLELARELAQHLGKDEFLVKRGSGAKAEIPASFRPRYSSYASGDFPAISVPDITGIIRYALG